MTFSPRLQGEIARPSPSRYELWKEELGIDGKTLHSFVHLVMIQLAPSLVHPDVNRDLKLYEILC